ncbi:MAG TPA: recombinase family protein [Candidatus Peribacterales bacterium]|nr:recombinase family protein [Candidatus Peribacterales bacterium]
MPPAATASTAETKIETPITRYVLYARKSQESDERQALSIDSQIKEMLAIAEREGLEIAETRRESHSAKASGARPIFKQLLADVRQGIFSGILTWAPDRLSRNAGDLGYIVDLMDQGLLKEIRTHGQRFTNNPNEKFLLMILCSQAKLENDNRGINVKRGQKTRAEMGYRPCMAPLGYLHERPAGESRSRVIVDPKRGSYISEMFEHMAYRGASGRTIYKWLKEEGLRTRAGKITTLSMVYRMLRNPYYTGRYEFPRGSGKWCKGDYKALVTEELFGEVQKLLDLVQKPEWVSKDFAFTKLMTCGGCGSGITAEEKRKKNKDGSVRRYVYYRCTHTKDLHCKEPSIREEELIKQLSELIDTIDFDTMGMKAKLEEEVARYQKFTRGVLGQKTKANAPEIDLKIYAKYILQEGTREERRELLGCLKDRLLLKEQRIILEKIKKKT